MRQRPATVLRLSLHLLLVLCLTLQAGAAMAMGTSMALALAAANHTEGTAALPASDLPPCHRLEAPDAADEPSALPSCCVDGGALCQWGCGGAPALAIPRITLAMPERLPGPIQTAAMPALPWPVSRLLRPPIA